MPRFQFQFASLLRLRESERDAARQEIADAFRALGILQQQREELQQQQQQLRTTAQQRLSNSSFSVDTMLNQGRYDLQLSADIQSIAANIAAVEVEVQRRQERLRAADIEVKRLERLQETLQRQWSDLEQAARQVELDEIASMRFARAQAKKGVEQWD